MMQKIVFGVCLATSAMAPRVCANLRVQLRGVKLIERRMVGEIFRAIELLAISFMLIDGLAGTAQLFTGANFRSRFVASAIVLAIMAGQVAFAIGYWRFVSRVLYASRVKQRRKRAKRIQAERMARHQRLHESRCEEYGMLDVSGEVGEKLYDAVNGYSSDPVTVPLRVQRLRKGSRPAKFSIANLSGDDFYLAVEQEPAEIIEMNSFEAFRNWGQRRRG